MTTINDTLRQAKRRAMKLAEFRLTNNNECKDCEQDLINNIGLSSREARTIAASYRAQVLPSVAKHIGLEEDYNKLVRLCGLEGRIPKMTADFAKGKDSHESLDDNIDIEDDELDDVVDDEDFGNHQIPTSHDKAKKGVDPNMRIPGVGSSAIGNHDADDLDDSATMDFGSDKDFDNDGLSEDNEGDSDTATVTVEVPHEQLEAFQQMLQDFMESQSGDTMEGDDNFDDEDDVIDSEDNDDNLSDPSLDDDIDDEPAAPTSDKRFPMAAKNRKAFPVNKNQQELAARRAERNKILGRVASSEENAKRDIGLGSDTIGGTYGGEKAKPIKKSNEAQYGSEEKYPTVTLENSGSNSLKAQNPTFTKLQIPTKNPNNLGLKDSYQVVTKEGGKAGDNAFEYEVDLDKLDWIPSEGGGGDKPFAIPTQMENRDRNTNNGAESRMASVSGYAEAEIEDAEEALYNALKTAGVSDSKISKMTMAQAITTLGKLRIASNEDVAITVNAEDETEEPETPSENKGKIHDDDFKRTPHSTDNSKRTSAVNDEVYKARLKTAWSITAKLCRAGIIDENGMEENVNMWMNDGLSVPTMISTGTQFLKIASTPGERVIESARSNTRTASIATNPVIKPTSNGNSFNTQNTDMLQALKTVLHDDSYEKYFADQEDRANRQHRF